MAGAFAFQVALMGVIVLLAAYKVWARHAEVEDFEKTKQLIRELLAEIRARPGCAVPHCTGPQAFACKWKSIQ